MGSPEVREDNEVAPAPTVSDMRAVEKEENISHVERVLSGFEKDNMNYDRVDSEVAKYTSDVRIHITDEESDRLRRLVDKRVLLIMILTYFLQAIDKGTLSFASIMGIQEDTYLVGQEVYHISLYALSCKTFINKLIV
jgi:hypothetical protein